MSVLVERPIFVEQDSYPWCKLCEKYTCESHELSRKHRQNVKKLNDRNAVVLEARAHARWFDENETVKEAMWKDDEETLDYNDSFARVQERVRAVRERILGQHRVTCSVKRKRWRGERCAGGEISTSRRRLKCRPDVS